ncbi:MAG: nucleotidyltransferase [Culicoidibacterales bacterium]
MEAIGIIVEYNPLHNGHLYHLSQAKQHYPDAVVIAVMSGNFLQRGEPALLDKWTRTQLALQAGIDLVIELPYAQAVQKADQFAWHSVKLLSLLHVQALIFGSEIGSITPFKLAWQQFQTIDTTQKARPLTLVKSLYETTTNPVFASPNNTLGFWYFAAQQQICPQMKIDTITRKAAAYHDYEFHGTIASATAIRQGLLAGWDCQTVVPPYTLSALQTQPHVTWEMLYPSLRHLILTTPLERLATFGLVSEGLEHRLFKAALVATTFTDFIAAIKTKRYTLTHLQRVCTHILTQTTQVELDLAQEIHHLRLLGASQRGFAYLKSIRDELSIPIMTNLKQQPSLLTKLEHRATLSYAPHLYNHEHRRKPLLREEG